MHLRVFFPLRLVVISAPPIAILALSGAFAQAPERTWPNASQLAEIRTSDVDLFYRIYDAAGGAPNADALQHDYIDAGSDGVRQFIPNRIKSAEALSMTIAGNPTVYKNARACMADLPAVRARLALVFKNLAARHPDAVLPPITILIGRNNSGGTTGNSCVLIGLEVVCRSDCVQPNIDDRL